MTKEILFENIIKSYNKILEESEKFLFFVRSKPLQENQRNELIEFQGYIKSYKNQAIEGKDEFRANAFFHFQSVLNSYISLFDMFVFLKEDKNVEAWAKLVDAQEYYSIASRATKDIEYLNVYYDHLNNIESTFFPKFPKYNSIGAIIKGGTCSICNADFDTCEHLEDKVYWGRLCKRVGYEIVEWNHLALVENPKDKRCVITHISTDDGFYRDYFTWEKTERIEEDKTEHMQMKLIMATTKLLDIY